MDSERRTFPDAGSYLAINGLFMLAMALCHYLPVHEDTHEFVYILLLGGVVELLIGTLGYRHLKARSAVRYLSITYALLGMWFTAVAYRDYTLGINGEETVLLMGVLMFLGAVYSLAPRRGLKFVGELVLIGFVLMGVLFAKDEYSSGSIDQCLFWVFFTLVLVQNLITVLLSGDSEPACGGDDGPADRCMPDAEVAGKKTDDSKD